MSAWRTEDWCRGRRKTSIAAVAVVLVSLCSTLRSLSLSSFAFVGDAQGVTQDRTRLDPHRLREAESREAAMLRRSAVLAALVAAPPQARALFGFFEGGPALQPFTIFDTFNVSMPPDFRVKERQASSVVFRGDRVQPLEVITAAAKVVTYRSLAEAFGTNATKVGERLAVKRLKGKGTSRLVEAKVDPTGAGLDAYAFEFDGDFLHELELVALVRRGSENVLCNIVLQTPRLLWEDRKELFPAILGSFKPLGVASASPASQAPVEAAP